MTSAELQTCAGTQPDPQVTDPEWVDGAQDCTTKSVAQTRTVVTTPYVWDGSSWVLDTANASTTTESGSRPMTSDELRECEFFKTWTRVKVSRWVVIDKDCDINIVTELRVVTTIVYTFDGRKVTKVTTTVTETRDRTALKKECPFKPKPAGISTYSLDGTKLTISAPKGIAPADAEWQYVLDGRPVEVGTVTLDKGSHRLALYVDGKRVDYDVVRVSVWATKPFGTIIDWMKYWRGFQR
jgi:hypothetical protein